MKKIFFTLLLMLLLINRVYAEELISFSCDYSYTNDKGIVKFRVKVSNVDKKYFKSDQEITNAGKDFWDSHVQTFYLDDSGSYQNTTSCTKNYANSNSKQLCILNTKEHKLKFINDAVESQSAVCPSLTYSDVSQVKILPKGVLDPSSADHTPPKPTSLISMNCYKDGKDTAPTKCNKVDLGELYTEGKTECEYTTNADEKTFKFIYDKEKNELEFYTMGSSLSLDSSVKSTTKNGKTYVLEEKILNQFKGTSTCPKYISCNCKAGALNVNKVCTFNEADARNKCGVLKTIDGNGDKADALTPGAPNLNIFEGEMDCEEILGENLTKIVHLAISMLRIAGAIIVIVNMTLAILEAVKDPDKIKSAKSKSISMLVILALIGLLPTLIKFIGNLLGLDLSCF